MALAIKTSYEEIEKNVTLIEDNLEYRIAFVVPDVMYIRTHVLKVSNELKVDSIQSALMSMSEMAQTMYESFGKSIRNASGYREVVILAAAPGTNTAAESDVPPGTEFFVTITDGERILITRASGEERIQEPVWLDPDREKKSVGVDEFNIEIKKLHETIRTWNINRPDAET